MGLTPSTWGPYFWGTIHLTCLGAPDILDDFDKKAYGAFFSTMPFTLPCGSCGQHFYEVLQVDPIDMALTSKYTLFEWSVRAHNMVNRRLNKPEVSLDDAIRHWSKVALGEYPFPQVGSAGTAAPLKPATPSTRDRDPQQMMEMVVMLIIGVLMGGGLGYMYSKRVTT